MRLALPKRVVRLLYRAGSRLPAKQHRHVSADERDDVRACIERGRELYNSRSYSGAITEFRQAVTINPHNQRALYFLANACYKANERNLAVCYWEQCISVDPASRFAGYCQRKIQHVRKQRQAGQDELDDFYTQIGHK